MKKRNVNCWSLDLGVRKEVSAVLRAVGMPMKLRGYWACREAIAMILEDDAWKDNTRKALYKAVAQKGYTTSSRVERNIRYAIGVAFKNRRLYKQVDKSIKEVFGHEVDSGKKGRPTNSQFILTIANYVKARME